MLQVKNITTDRSVSSDHFAVLFNISKPKPTRPKVKISVRKWSSIDVSEFNNEILNHDPSELPSTDWLSIYNGVLNELLNKYAPQLNIEVTERSSTPWYSSDIQFIIYYTSCQNNV